MPTSYLVGVSTWPEDRSRGYISRLITKSLEIMKNRGHWFSILLPFNYEFYRKYGWETCYLYNQYSGNRTDFSNLLGNIEWGGEFRPINLSKDLNKVSLCYSFYTQNLNGYVLRDQDDWDRILSDIKLDGGDGYIYERNGEMVGFIFLIENGDGVSIRSLCSRDLLGYKEMLQFAVNYSRRGDRVIWSDRGGCPTMPNMLDSGIEKREKPFVMGRIIDVREVFQNISLAKDIDLVIEVSDPFLECNNQRFHFTSKNFELFVTTTSNLPDFKIPISTLSQLLWGYYTPQQVMQYGLIEVYNSTKIEDLDILFPETTPFMYEDY